MPRSRHDMLVPVVIAAMILAGILLPVSIGAESPPPDAYLDILPERRGDIIARTGEHISSYTIDAEIDPASVTITGEQTVDFTNATTTALNEVFFRLFPNAEYYGEGDLRVSDVTVDGQDVVPSIQDGDPTVLQVPLTEALANGSDVEITMSFQTVVPTDTEGSYGILNQDSESGSWVLADWYPIVAGYEPGLGWRLDPPTSFGDPTFGDAALYDVTLDAPPDWEMVSSGIATLATGEGTHRWVAGPARDFSLVANAGEAVARRNVAGTELTVYGDLDSDTAVEVILETASDALAAYSDLLGVYPYRELDLVATPLAGAVGVSWAGIIFLDIAAFDTSAAGHEALTFTVAHEVGHQWWGGILGVNSNDHTFMTEGITNALTIIFLETSQGEDAAASALRTYIADPYLELLNRSGDLVVDVPIAEGQQDRGPIWYGKAALGFLAIRQRIGDDAFFAALGTYGDTFAQRIAGPADLLAAFEAASGEELDELWRFWFDSDDVTAADVEAVVAGV